MKWSLGFRLAVLVGLLGMLQAAGVLAFSYLAFEREIDLQQRIVLRDKLEQTRALVGSLSHAAALKDNAFRLYELVKAESDLHMVISVMGSPDAQVAFSREAIESLQRLRLDVWGADAYLEWQAAAGRTPMLSLASTASTRDGELVEVVLSMDRAKGVGVLRQLLLTALTAAPFALAAVMLAAAVVVGIGLAPLRRLVHAASRVTASRLHERLDTRRLPHELLELAQAFNAMLDRLSDSVNRLSQFSADLAHEMRTPLTALLARTQVTLSQERSRDELADVLVQNVEELQRLSRLVADMLFLAQADQAQQAVRLESVDVGSEAQRIAEFLALAAADRGIRFEVYGTASLVADRGLVQRALTNLMTNALTHARPGSQVSVKTESDQGGTTISVENEGEGIAREHLDRIFERFYRVDPARQRQAGGTGLGLSIVQAIMNAHRGSAHVQLPAPERVRFVLRFPRATKDTSINAVGNPGRPGA